MSAATEIRGALAARLICWHRLTEQEANQLVDLHWAQNAKLDARQAKIDALQKDAERYRYLRSRHWNEGGLYVIYNPLCKVQLLGLDCPSDERLDGAIDAAMAKSKQGCA